MNGSVAFASTATRFADGMSSRTSSSVFAPISVPVPDSDPQTVRRLLEKGTILLLRRFAGHVPDKALFLDSYQFADDASLSLLESLGMIAEGWPLTVIAATRERKERSIANHVVIPLEPLSLDVSKKLTAHLTGGTKLSDAVLEDILRLANGVPLHIVELARSLLDMDRASLEATGAHKTVISLPASILSTMVSRIDRLDASAAPKLEPGPERYPDISSQPDRACPDPDADLGGSRGGKREK